MRKNFGAKPLSYPQPVFIIATYGEDGTPDAMNAAWGGISEMNEISMCLSAGHKTVKNILKRRAFTVSMADADHVNGKGHGDHRKGNDHFYHSRSLMLFSHTPISSQMIKADQLPGVVFHRQLCTNL